MTFRKHLIRIALVVIVALLSGSARGQDAAPSDAVERVVAIHATGDGARLADLADSLKADPWVVTEGLLARGEGGAATAFAAASRHPRFNGLRAYVTAYGARTRPPEFAAALELVTAALAAGDPERASADLARARDLLADDDGIAATLAGIELGLVLARAGDSAAARPLLESSTHAAENLGWLRGAADGHNGLGICAQDPLDLEALEREYAMVAALRDRIGDGVGASQAYTNLAVTRTMGGNYATALPALERATELLGPHSDDPENAYSLAHLLMTQGAVHARLGESANAAVALQRSLRLMPPEDNDDAIAQILSDLTSAFLALGDIDSAASTQERLIVMEERRDDALGVASALQQQAAIEIARSRWDEALTALRRAREFSIGGGTAAGELYVDLDVARVLRAQGRVEEVVELLTVTLERLQSAGLETAIPYAQNALGEALTDVGRPGDALEVHTSGLAAARRLGQTDEAVLNLTGVARARLALGDHAEAMSAAREVVADQAALLRNAAADQAPRARAVRSEIYELGTRAARAAGDVESLCFFLESGRAGALLETMRSRDAFRTAVVPEHLRAEILRLRRERADAQSAVRDAYEAGANLKELRAVVTAQRAAESRERAVEAEIERGRRFGAAMLYPKAASLAELRAALGPRDVLVLYSVLSDDAFAVVVPGGGRPARIAELGRSDALRERATTLLDLAGTRALAASAVADGAWAALEAATASLREVVTDPLALPEGTERVLISPDGPLGQVPFAVLLAHPQVVFVPSGTALVTLSSGASVAAAGRGESILAVGDPTYDRASGLPRLPASRGEVEALPDPAVRLLGDEATVANLEAALAATPAWRSVHFACHGLLADDPWRSALALTPDAAGSGRLTALDVVGMSIPADLVVLSACESGRGTVLRGEGLVGLTHGFLGAGARRVVVGLWQVDDEASRAFMAAFYEAWDGGSAAVAEALRAAQRAVSAQEKWRHPYYWAAWVQWGAPG